MYLINMDIYMKVYESDLILQRVLYFFVKEEN
jgi:hypothetical protein